MNMYFFDYYLHHKALNKSELKKEFRRSILKECLIVDQRFFSGSIEFLLEGFFNLFIDKCSLLA